MSLLRVNARARTALQPEPAPPALEPGGWGGGGPADYDPGAPTGPLETSGTTTGEHWFGGQAGEASAPITNEGREMEYIREVVLPAGMPAAPTAIMSGGEGTELPHWADPPTGEVPRALAGPEEDDEMQAWHLLGSRGLHWRDDVNAWSNGPGVEDLADEEAGFLPAEAQGDPFSFDEDFDRLERERSSHRTGPAPRGARVPASPAEASMADDGVPVSAARSQGANSGGASSGGASSGGAGSQGGGDPGQPALDVFPPTLAASQPAGVGAGEVGPPAQDGVPEPAEAPRRAPRPRGGGPRLTVPRGRPVRRASTAPAGPAMGPRVQAPRRQQPPYDVYAEAGLGGPGRNVGAAVVTGAALIAVFVVCYLIGPAALLALSALAVLGCALEAFSMVQEVGFRPATLVGALGAAGVVLAAYWKGTAGVPVVVAVVLVASFVWYLARVVEARPVVNAAVTFLVFSWVGVLGSFAGLLLAAPKGSHLFLGAVVPTVACDIAAWFAGSRIGSHHLAPETSPGKTWEGAIAGAIVAVIVGAVIGHELAPWGGLRHGLELGVVIAIVAPIGDLVQSMVKRDLHLKDSGALLPGHGGLLDRFDSLLFVLPAVYFLTVALHLAG